MQCHVVLIFVATIHRSIGACNTNIQFVSSMDTLARTQCCVTIENQKHEGYALYASARDDVIEAYPRGTMGKNQIWKVVKNGPSYQLINVGSHAAVCTNAVGDVTKCPIATDFLQQWTPVASTKDSKYVALVNANTEKALEGQLLKNGRCKGGKTCVEIMARDTSAGRPRQMWKIAEKSCSG
uniref:Hypothetical secreted protein n=1 Tax=Simulium vittatum TaxID=7192 RepID=B5M0M1_SIMVI|nr:hypothetical secreted protein [Simulium vittatum]